MHIDLNSRLESNEEDSAPGEIKMKDSTPGFIVMEEKKEKTYG